MKRWPALWLAHLLPTLLASCIVYRPIQVHRIPEEPSRIESPAKAHLLDGSTLVYPDGVIVTAESLMGSGRRYGADLQPRGPAGAVPLDSIGAMESFPHNLDGTRTVALSAGAAVAGVIGGALLAVAVFGSCPTVYADSAGHPVLQAELFSHSIAPLFETRDIDRLSAQPGPEGTLSLEVWNEALETHYINHVELLEVTHAPHERVVPDERGRPLAASGFLAPDRVTDRVGRDLRAALARVGGSVFESADQVRNGATAGDLEDWIDVTARVPAGTDSVAVVLRMRNSLLNTVLFYDVMLGPRGARSLDWVGKDLARIGDAARLGRWYRARTGMRVEVREQGGSVRWTGRIGDAGPIAWKDVAIVVPAPVGDTLRFRLSFLADHWRIDRLEIAPVIRRPAVRQLSPVTVIAPGGSEDLDARVAVGRADEDYLATGPGQRFTVQFDVGPDSAHLDPMRTYLVAAQGYYIEWIRGDWIRGAVTTEPFRPDDGALAVALRRWRDVREEFESRFFASRVPVR